MNCARCAVDCRPRSGWTVDKELTLQKSTLDSVLTLETKAEILAALARAIFAEKENRKPKSWNNYKGLRFAPMNSATHKTVRSSLEYLPRILNVSNHFLLRPAKHDAESLAG